MRNEKDVIEKTLLDYNDVFADVVNAVLPLDEPVNPDDLEDVKTRTHYHREIHEQERDVAKLWKKGKIIFCLLGFENQTQIDKTMPLRTFGYEGGDYRKQVSDRDAKIKAAKKSGNYTETKRLRLEKFYPVVTIVLYYGKRRWKNNRTLFECLDIPKGLKPFLNDIHLNIVEVAWLSDEEIGRFKSDFRIVADYFRQIRIDNNYNPTKEVMLYVDTTLKMMRLLTNNSKFEEAQAVLHDEIEKGERVSMFDAFRRFENRGRAEGKAEGFVEGKLEALKEVYHRLIETEGFSPEYAAKITGYSIPNV